MSAPNRTPSPSELAQLEQAYARTPGDGWRPLAEAYLARGRYMEAMVVAKRGGRARPDDAGPHVVLARIHAAQRKADKARAAAAEALALAPADAEVLALAREHGLAVSELSAAAAGLAQGDAAAAGKGAADGSPGDDAARDVADAESRARWTHELAERYGQREPEDPAARRKRAKRGMLRTAALAIALAVGLAAAAGIVSQRRARAEEQRQLLADAGKLVEKDSWAGYRDAQARCERAAGLGGPGAAAAHACAAWSAVLRWAEHGEGEPLRAKAVEHLGRAGAEAERPREAVLAAASLELRGGNAGAAVTLLRARSATDGSGPLRAALGEALAAAGDRDAARDALMAAQQLAPGSPRIARQLADHLRGDGEEGAANAATLYEIVLQKLAPDHVPSLIGKAHLLLRVNDGAGALAAAHRVAELGDRASPRQRARALALEARALARLGKRAEAEAAERAARSLDAEAPELREPLAHAAR